MISLAFESRHEGLSRGLVKECEEREEARGLTREDRGERGEGGTRGGEEEYEEQKNGGTELVNGAMLLG